MSVSEKHCIYELMLTWIYCALCAKAIISCACDEYCLILKVNRKSQNCTLVEYPHLQEDCSY